MHVKSDQLPTMKTRRRLAGQKRQKKKQEVASDKEIEGGQRAEAKKKDKKKLEKLERKTDSAGKHRHFNTTL